MKRYGVYPSVRLSVPSWAHSSKPAAVSPTGRRYRSIAEFGLTAKLVWSSPVLNHSPNLNRFTARGMGQTNGRTD